MEVGSRGVAGSGLDSEVGLQLERSTIENLEIQFDDEPGQTWTDEEPNEEMEELLHTNIVIVTVIRVVIIIIIVTNTMHPW